MSICFISPHSEERERANSKEESKEKCNKTAGPQIWIFLVSTIRGGDILGPRVFVSVPNNRNTAVSPCNFPSLAMFYKPACWHALSRLLKCEFLEGSPLGFISIFLSVLSFCHTLWGASLVFISHISLLTFKYQYVLLLQVNESCMNCW